MGGGVTAKIYAGLHGEGWQKSNKNSAMQFMDDPLLNKYLFNNRQIII